MVWTTYIQYIQWLLYFKLLVWSLNGLIRTVGSVGDAWIYEVLNIVIVTLYAIAN